MHGIAVTPIMRMLDRRHGDADVDEAASTSGEPVGPKHEKGRTRLEVRQP